MLESASYVYWELGDLSTFSWLFYSNLLYYIVDLDSLR